MEPGLPQVWVALTLCAVALVACERRPDPGERALEGASPATPSASGLPQRLAPPESGRDERAECGREIERTLAEPALGGVPALESRRVSLFIAVKGEPTLFVRQPDREPTADVGIIAYRRWLDRSSRPGVVVAQLIEQLEGRPDFARATFLRDGYLYADGVGLGDALVRYLRADLLFEDPEIWIERGEQVFRAVRDAGEKRYVHADGDHKGRPASLLLFDRVGTGPRPPGLHRDVRALRYRLGFERLQVRHLTANRIVANLQYGGCAVPTLLEARGARLARLCELLPAGEERRVEQARRSALEQSRAFRAVQRAIAAHIADGLPFDEPKHEVDQADGALRPLFRDAYAKRKLTYEYNDDRYPVFDARGRPQVPEVCVDFLLDSIERAAGTWWRPRGEARERVIGRIDFDELDRDALRGVPGFIQFVREHPQWFDLLEVPERDRVVLGHPEDFTRYLLEHADDFRPGDMLLIGGHVPWDPRKYVHHHSFFVFDSDPLTGMPLLVASNPGRPGLRTWKAEMRRTPLRTLRVRVRPRAEWLASVVIPEPEGEVRPPSLAE